MLQVDWGKSSMIAAERLLLEAALEDTANQRFVLLSDRCFGITTATFRCSLNILIYEVEVYNFP